MSHIILKKWEQLKDKVRESENNLDSNSLVYILLDWAKEIKSIKDIQIKQLYKDFLERYEDLDVESILYTGNVIWYSLEEIIKFDILTSNVDYYQRPIVKTRDILFNILAFKSDKKCPCCGDDNLRVFVERNSEKLFFECDICLCLFDEYGIKHENLETSITFAPISLLKSKNIKPSPI